MEKLKKITGQWNKRHLEIIKTNILSKIHDDHFKNVTSRVSARFSFDWAWWPSFWHQVTQFYTRPRNRQDTNILSNIYDDYLKKCDLWSVNSLICPGDLVFDPMWPSFELDLEIIKTNILGKIHDDCFKNVTSRVLKRSSFDLAWWPNFDPKWPSFELELIKTNILSKIHDDCFKNVTARVLTRFSFDLAWWPSFWPNVTQFQIWPRNHQDKQFEQDSWSLLEKCDRLSVNKVYTLLTL